MNNNLERLTGSLESYINEKILTGAPLDHDHLGYAKKTDLATVAFSGRYSDLIGLPSSSSSDLNSYATINYVNTAIAEAKLNGSINLDDYVKQEQLETYVQSAELKEVAFSGSYNDLTDTPAGLLSEEQITTIINNQFDKLIHDAFNAEY